MSEVDEQARSGRPAHPGVARAALLLLVAPLAVGCAAPVQPRPPRGILVLLVDCLRADHLGAYGSTLGATPSLDSLAGDAVVFDRASAVASWTRPSVPSLWTGLYPTEHGLTDLIVNGRGVRGGVLVEEAMTIAEALQAAGYRTALLGNQLQLSVRFNLAQGFDLYRNNQRSASSMHEAFFEWLDAAPERPFFAYLHYLEVHWPYWPKPSTHGRYGSDLIESDLDGDIQEVRRRIRSGELRLSAADRRELAARYEEALAALDAEIGLLTAELERRGLLAETLVIVTADHGEELGERGGIEHGHTLAEELLHVPFVWKLPASWRGRRPRHEAALVETRTLAPTLFDLVGQPIPERVSAPSLMPWLVGRPPAAPPFEFVAAESNGIFAVRTERWKLVATPAARRFELFDLLADPGERENLASARPAELAALRDRLRTWRAGLHPLETRTAPLEQETIEGLRALGYIQ